MTHTRYSGLARDFNAKNISLSWSPQTLMHIHAHTHPDRQTILLQSEIKWIDVHYVVHCTSASKWKTNFYEIATGQRLGNVYQWFCVNHFVYGNSVVSNSPLKSLWLWFLFGLDSFANQINTLADHQHTYTHTHRQIHSLTQTRFSEHEYVCCGGISKNWNLIHLQRNVTNNNEKKKFIENKMDERHTERAQHSEAK